MPGSAKGSTGSASAVSATASANKAAGLPRPGSAGSGLNRSSMGAAVKVSSAPKSVLPGMARVPHVGMTRAASTEDLGTAADVATFRPPVGVDRMERNAKRAVATPGLRRWLRFDKSGRTSMLNADKHAIAQKTGVQLRDLRVLDPQLSTSYPSAILARETCLVVNLEFIKALITTDYVLILNAEEEIVLGFIEELQRRLVPKPLGIHRNAASSPELSGMGDGHRAEGGDLAFDGDEAGFELRVLEVALDVVCNHLERLSVDLEAAAHPALDALTRKVTTHNLERVRKIKSRMVRLKTRGETIREVLEKYLDDDGDMKDMNLSAKAEESMQRMASLQRRSMDSHASHAYQHTQEVDEALQPDESHQETKHPEGPDPTQPPQPQQGTEASGASGGGLPPVAAAFVAAGPRLPGTGDATGAGAGDGATGVTVPGGVPILGRPPVSLRPTSGMAPAGSPPGLPSGMRSLSPLSLGRTPSVGRRTSFSAPSPRNQLGYDDDSSSDGDLNEVEMLLEAYFMQVDNTCNKLQTLHEYIDDTEDYLNIELDSHRNQLIQLELLLTAAMFALALVTVIAGIFGMNLNNKHEDSYSAFVMVSVFSCVGAGVVFIAIVLYCRKQKLLC